MKATCRLPYQVYKDLPDGFKKWMKEHGNDKDKVSDGKTSAHDHIANQAEMVVPSTVSVSTEATGIMGTVTGTSQLHPTFGMSSSLRGEQLQAAEENIV